MKLKFLLLMALSVFLISCKPEQAPANFNLTIGVPVGDDITLQVNEDENLQISYEVAEDEKSVNLEAYMAQAPKNGRITQCDTSVKNKINCNYKPNSDFNGVDYIKVGTRDGDIQAGETSTIKIQILPIADAPVAQNLQTEANSGEMKVITLPMAVDSDSLLSDLEYSIEAGPQNGTLSNCRSNGLYRTCEYTTSASFFGQDSFTYSVQDETQEKSNTATVSIQVARGEFMGEENFIQDPVNNLKGADIVWVIDNSGSMSNNQNTLKANFQSFINNFLDNGKAKFDFKMGVITTDVYLNGPSEEPFETDSSGNIYNLTSTQAETNFTQFKSDFEKAVLVGIDGDGDERVLDSMDKAYQLNPSFTGGNDRMLVYIVLSDEPEQSFKKSVTSWVSDFQGLKDKPEKVKMYPIIDPGRDNGDRYKIMANLTGTKVYDIDNAFDEILDDISKDVEEKIQNFRLRSDVNILADTIKVYVDGNQVSNWSYTNGAIVFDQNPATNAQIKVTYNYETL